jgi:hypothetical protein
VGKFLCILLHFRCEKLVQVPSAQINANERLTLNPKITRRLANINRGNVSNHNIVNQKVTLIFPHVNCHCRNSKKAKNGTENAQM